MDTSNIIEYVLDEEFLANVKSNDLGVGDARMQEQCLEESAEPEPDPLQENMAAANNMSWSFNDEDILLDEEQLAATLVKAEGKSKGRSKRRRLSATTTFASSSGYNWSAERDAAHVPDELALPVTQACGKGPAKTVSNALESWMLLFDDEILRHLTRHINEQMRKRRIRIALQRPIDLIELRSWLGLTYLCGVFRNGQHNGPLEELWTLELGNVIFRSTMTITRFEFIAECLCWDDNWEEPQHIWKKLLINCRSYYGASSWLCVDEQPSHMDGTYQLLCCDAKTLYLANAFLVQQTMSTDKELDHLLCDIKATGRNVTVNGRHTSLSNCEHLWHCQLSTVAILTNTASDCPLGLSECVVDSLHCGAARLVRKDDKFLLSCGLSRRANVEQVYKLTSQACGKFHELSNRYSTVHAMPRLNLKSGKYLQLLHHMLNIAAFNAWILLRLSPRGDAAMEQRDFQRQLGLFLTQQRLQRRLQRKSSTTLTTKLQICEILGQSNQRLLSEATSSAQQSQSVGVLQLEKATLPEGVTLASRYGDKHRRCKPCAREKRETKSRQRCQQCLAHRCGNHLIARCFECMGVMKTGS